MRLPGLGPKTAARIWRELGVTTLAELKAAAEGERLRTLAGMGADDRGEDPEGARRGPGRGRAAARPARQGAPRRARGRRGAAGAPCRDRRLRGGQHAPAARDVPRSRRDRDRDRSGRADRALRRAALGARGRRPRRHEGDRDHASRASASTSASSRRRATATCCSTSPARRSTTSRCASRRSGDGLSVSEYGVTVVETGEVRTFRDEEALYAFLGYSFIPPELRENGGELEAARDGTLPRLVELGDLRGEMHCHSTWSADGKATIEEMALRRGRARLRVPLPDRPLALPPRGEDRGAVARDRGGERARSTPFRVLRGIEANITAKGVVDVPDDVLAELDWVVASLHTSLDRSPTERVLAAIDNPHVDCIGHLTGRRISRRAGAELDLDRVVAPRRRDRHGARDQQPARPARHARRPRAARGRGRRARSRSTPMRTRRRRSPTPSSGSARRGGRG